MSEKKEEKHFPVDQERLSLIFQELPVNQSELSEQLHISTSELSKWKSGERSISSQRLKKLCAIACCNPSWLLGLSDHRYPEITWRQLEITQESGKLDKTAQTLLLAFLEAATEEQNSKIIDQLGKMLIDVLTKKSD